nr:uncharacterized protein LOC115258279 [Aedes albopictus]XP_029716415.1 uncharacterized protein LOC115259761 [Aedes albopictus]
MVIAARDVIVDESESFQYKPDVQEKNPKRSKDAEIVRIRRLAESDSESDEGTSSAMDGVMDESVDHFEDCGGSISEGDDDSAGAIQQVEESVVYYEDNQSCMRVAEEPRDSRRMKHVDIKFNFIRELVQRGDMVIKYIPSERQLADVMTKGLPAVAFKRLLEAIGIKGSRN